MEIVWIVLYGLLFLRLQDMQLVCALTFWCMSLMSYLYVFHRLDIYGLCVIRQSWYYLVYESIPFLLICLWNIFINFSLKIYNVNAYTVIVLFFCAFVEEIFFRGFLFSKFNIKNYVITNGALFSLFHLTNIFDVGDVRYTVFQLLWALCMGVSFALLRILCKSIIPGVIFHALINVTSMGNDVIATIDLVITSVLAILCMGYLLIIYHLLTNAKEKKDL